MRFLHGTSTTVVVELVALFICLRVLMPLAAQTVVINEAMSSNGTTLTDENGDTPDWLELYNPGTQALDLAGYGLSDDVVRPFKWTFKTGQIAPGAFLLVFASGKDRQPKSFPPVHPAVVPGLKVWLSADTIQTNDASQVRVGGGNLFVRRWVDQSGLGNHAQQAAEAQQPVLASRVPGLNNQPALHFNGINTLLTLAAPPAQNNFCLIAVVKPTAPHEVDSEGNNGVGGVSGQRYLFGAMHGGDFNAGAGLSVGTNGVSVYEHGSSYMPALAVFAGPVGPGFAVVSVNYLGRQPSLFFQGNLARTGATSARQTVTAPTEIGAGAYGAFAGDVAEILVYDRTLSDPERRQIEEYVARKYSLELPAPYHTSFQLSAGGETLLLTHPNGQRVDQCSPVALARDISYGRAPDGGTNWYYFREPTPGRANTTPGSAELLEMLLCSHAAGFYTNAFTLTLASTNPGAALRYTLDGAEPTQQSTLYTAPLAIKGREGTPNGISTIPTAGGWQPPAGEVFKAWLVRARAFKTNALPSPTLTRTFFVTPRGGMRYTVPVISLSTHRDNFFDPNIGIYVPGNTPGGNFSQRGPEWERPVHVEFFETNGVLIFAQDAGVKIHGNTSQGFPIKGLDLDGTSGAGRKPFRHRFFPERDRKEFEHLLLRPSGHDSFMALMRDELMQSLVEELGVESQAARAAVVFLNGEYWGLSYLKEKEDADFISHYGRMPPGEFDFLEGYAAAKAGDTLHYQRMWDFIATRDLKQATNYAHVQTLMEVDNYALYKAAEIFYYRWDIGNHRLWRPRTETGRWRWLQFDNDVGWGGFWAEQPAWAFNMLEADLTPSGSLHDHNGEVTTFLLRRLMDNEDFKRDFINRFADLLNTTFHPNRTIARINQMAAVLAPEMTEHTRRWRAPASLVEWQNHVQYLHDYAVRRPDYCRLHLLQRFSLRGTNAVFLAVSDPNQGAIQLNTLTVDAATNAPWQGIYFKGNPITVTARPRPGFRFSGWRGIYGITTNSVTLLLNGDLALTALFNADPAAQPAFTLCQRLPNGRLRLQISGAPNGIYWLQTTTNLPAWSTSPALTNGPDGRFEWEEPISADLPSRFYRVLLP